MLYSLKIPDLINYSKKIIILIIVQMNKLEYSQDSCKLITDHEKINWPKNNGCDSSGERKVLIVPRNYKGIKGNNIIFLHLIDRFGPPTGKFFGDAGVTWKERSLPWFQNNTSCEEKFDKFIKSTEYNQYIVLKPFDAYTCTIAPAFGVEGGAQQYRTDMTVQELVSGGFIEKADKNDYIPPKFKFGKKITRKIHKSSITRIRRMIKYLLSIK
jgi:hypothetical protein